VYNASFVNFYNASFVNFYNASFVNFYNATGSLARLINALACFNAGVVAVNFKVVGLTPG
jgi:hypothetical protein